MGYDLGVHPNLSDLRTALPTQCQHCKTETQSGTHGGCVNCGKVKHRKDGRKNYSEEDREDQ